MEKNQNTGAEDKIRSTWSIKRMRGIRGAKRKSAGVISVLMLMTLLSGCGRDIPPQEEGAAQISVSGEGAADHSLSGSMSADPGTEKDGGAVSSGNPQASKDGQPEVYYMDELYTKEEDILPITQEAAVGGISYKVESVEYTESFGNRNRENLQINMAGAEPDGQGTLPEGYKYLFLTITFTNIADQTQEIYRTSNSISIIGASLNTLSWTSDACYYDMDWEKGTASQKHHWVLEPGESVTSEIGWVIESCGIVLDENDALATRMGSGGPYALYYCVRQYDGSNEGSKFIDLGVKVE